MPEEAGVIASFEPFALCFSCGHMHLQKDVLKGFYEVLPDQVDGEIGVGYLHLDA